MKIKKMQWACEECNKTIEECTCGENTVVNQTAQHTPTPLRLRPMNINRVYKPIIDLILDGWYQPPTEKFNDKGERFYDEAEAILSSLLENALSDFQNSVDEKREEVGL